jgi:hypothetical protein
MPRAAILTNPVRPFKTIWVGPAQTIISSWGGIPMKDPAPPVVRTIGYMPSDLKVNQCYRHLQEHLKIKVPVVREARGEGAFWTPRRPEEGYSWHAGLIPIREGFDGVMKISDEPSGLHEIINVAALGEQWRALVKEATSRSSPKARAR